MDQLIDQVRGYSFGRMSYLRGGIFGPIQRPYLSLLFVEKGGCTMRSNAGSVTVMPGQVGFLAGTRQFEFRYEAGTETIASWCEGFLPEIDAGLVQDQLGLYSAMDLSPRLRNLQEIGLGSGLESSADLNSFRNALGHAICRAFLLEARQNRSDQTLPSAVLSARSFIKEKMADDQLDVTSVAQHVSMSPQHLIATFKRTIGTTPGKYIWQVRAARARQYLIHTRLSQAQIAFNCGYKSVAHFSRSLKSQYGATPGGIRRDRGYAEPSDTDGSVKDLLF